MSPSNRFPCRTTLSIIAWSLLLSLLFGGLGLNAHAQEPVRSAAVTTEEPAASLPGVDLARGITELTGVAISPLLGVSVVGAWHYWNTAEADRIKLPWFCHPLAWGLGFALLGCCFLKDLAGPATPVLIKKPLDAAELFENKISALIGCAAFVPFVAAQLAGGMPSYSGHVPAATVSAGGPLLAASPMMLGSLSSLAMWIILPLCLAGFSVVWIVSHSLNVLILLSPFGLIDSVLKAIRLSLLGSIVLISAIHPVLGAILCLGIIVIAAFLAPWAFRLAVFGGVMAGDALRSLVFRSPAPQGRLMAFLAHSGGRGFPARTLGHVAADTAGRVRFSCRRLFVGAERSLDLGEGSGVVWQSGLVFPSLSGTGEQGECVKPRLMLLPRYRAHQDAIVARLGLGGVRDAGIVRGIRGAWAWIRDAVSPSRTAPPVLE
jgi:hypothetical protein